MFVNMFVHLKDLSFHVSVAWFLGDICFESTQDIQSKLQVICVTKLVTGTPLWESGGWR